MSVYSTFGLGPKNLGGGGDNITRMISANEVMTKSGMKFGRPAAYAMNGSGRDTYIAVDNGGFSKPFEPAFTPETGVFKQRN